MIFRDQRGSETVERLVLVCLLALAGIGAVRLFSSHVKATFERSASTLEANLEGIRPEALAIDSLNSPRVDPPAAASSAAQQGPRPADDVLALVHGLDGWSELSADNRRLLDNILGGRTNLLSAAARQWVEKQLDAGLSGESPAQQGVTLLSLIGNKKAMPAIVVEPVAGNPVDVSLSGPVEVANHGYRSGTAAAERWIATYSDGAQIEIYFPKGGSQVDRLFIPNAAEAADAARYLPHASRVLIKRIEINPQGNPDDAHYKLAYHDPDFRAAMSATADGIVDMYPAKNVTPARVRGSLLHETAHTWSETTWGRDTSVGKWKEWANAMIADKHFASGYASDDIKEDLAETAQALGSTKGTRAYDEYRLILPHRAAIYEKELK